MTTETPLPVSGDRVRTPGAFAALYLLVLRHQVTRARLALFAVVAAISVGLGWLLSLAGDDRRESTLDAVTVFGMGLVVPVVALVLGSAALGTWVDDETLVYVWLRPVRRWTIALAAGLAAATVAVPVTAASLATMAAIGTGGDGEVIGATALAAGLGGLAYTSVFVALGLLIRRALVWGLIYVFIWEFFVARAGAGAARLSLNSYANSILSKLTGHEILLADRGLGTSYVVLATVSAVAVAFTTWRLHRANVA